MENKLNDYDYKRKKPKHTLKELLSEKNPTKTLKGYFSKLGMSFWG